VTPCPPREQFLRLLRGLLDDGEEQSLDVHLKSCPACLKTLNELTDVSSPMSRGDGPRSYPPLPERRTNSSREVAAEAPVPSAEFLNRLQNQVRPDSATGKGAAGHPRLEAGSDDGLPQVEGYQVLGVLGRGGMGVVYKAEQVALRRVVALKMIRSSFVAAPGSRGRFRTEVMAIARLQHPHIVQIFEVGEADDLPYYALEYVAGGSLADRLTGAPPSPRDAAELMERVARAVHFAHEHGIVHRDLKPGNILLTAEGAPKIADFGLAKLLENEPGTGAALPSITAAELIQGTPCYMAPEQASPGRQGQQIGAAADVYALGAILYELLAGRPPFRSQSPLETALQVVHEEPTPPRRFRPDVPRDLETICLKCLAKDPARRFASALALADDLRRFQAGEPIRARPVSRTERVLRWGRRNPVIAALLAALALVLIAALALVTWKWRAAVESSANFEQEKVRADRARRDAERLAARGLLEQAINQGDHGNTDRALHVLARGLELAIRVEDEDLERAIRLNLTAWRSQLLIRRATLPHDNWVWAVAYSPDGRLCATASRDKTARLWSTITGRPVCEPLAHKFPVWTVAFSPDGKSLLTGSGDEKTGQGEVGLWEVPSGKPLPHPLGTLTPGGEQFAFKAAFSPDGRTILVLGDGTARLWKTNEGARPIELPHPGGVMAAVLSPDGHTVVTGGTDGTARLWDAATGKPIGPPLSHIPPVGLPPGQRCSVVTAAFSPDGQLVLTGSQVDDEAKKKSGGDARLWRASTGAAVGEPWPQPGPLKSVVFSPDGRRALTCGLEVDESGDTSSPRGEARLWDVATGRTIGPALKQSQPIWAAAFSPDGRVLLTGSRGGEIQYWLTATGSPLGPHMLRIGNVNAVAFSPDGTTSLTSRTYEPSEATLWEFPTGTGEVVPKVRSPGVRAMAFSRDGKMLVTAGADGTAQVWDTDRSEKVGPPLRHTRGLIDAAAFSPGGKTLATAGEDSTVRLWELLSGTPVGQPLANAVPALAVAFSPDGKTLLSGGERATVRLWDVAGGKPLDRPPVPVGWVRAVAFSPDGLRFAVVDDEGTRLYDAATRQPRGAFMRQEGFVAAIAFSPDGRTLATGGEGNMVWLWDVDTGEPLCQPLQHPGLVRSVSFSGDGKGLVTGSADGAARLWDVATGLRIGPVLSHPGPVLAAFRPGSDRFATVAEDGLLRWWEVPVPARGDASAVRQWAEALTGKELTDKGILKPTRNRP
jgi:WD40 repeat protein/serine/threonine protein kinase